MYYSRGMHLHPVHPRRMLRRTYLNGLAIMWYDLERALKELGWGYAPALINEYLATMGVHPIIAKPKHVIMANLSVT